MSHARPSRLAGTYPSILLSHSLVPSLTTYPSPCDVHCIDLVAHHQASSDIKKGKSERKQTLHNKLPGYFKDSKGRNNLVKRRTTCKSSKKQFILANACLFVGNGALIEIEIQSISLQHAPNEFTIHVLDRGKINTRLTVISTSF